ncbi:hypothetical protein LX32DRAFT_636141 [Colletotrichum zoysiae]|uniref:Uncharacterized protein n=1 Tax=Colletotrichum zoysiae TaxID=1216348 RepID=A0AAD9HQW9_9PEZI|nr:hypothetical protein LX32DRAFT_636141 [Colletotrichum zoysiae]
MAQYSRHYPTTYLGSVPTYLPACLSNYYFTCYPSGSSYSSVSESLFIADRT